MRRMLYITAAFVIMTASWVSAGSFSVLSENAQLLKPTPLYLAPGAVVKAEFKSNVGRGSEMELESDALLPEPKSDRSGPNVTPKPAVAFRERPSGAMAPPPAVEPRRPAVENRRPTAPISVAQAGEEKQELDLDLEKDLVLQPPPRKTSESAAKPMKPVVDAKGDVKEQKKVEKQIRKKSASTDSKRRKAATPGSRYLAQNIRKVRPLSQTAWNIPAGSHGRYGQPVYRAETPVPEGRRIACPPTTEGYMRDGVPIRLAPRQMPPAPEQQYPSHEEDLGGEDLMSAAAEVISLPFAFISSLF